MTPPRSAADKAAILLAICLPTLVTLSYFVWLSDRSAAWQQASYVLGKAAQFGFPIFWVVLVQGLRPTFRERTAAGVFNGIVSGAALLVLMCGLYHYWLKPAGFFAASQSEIRDKVTDLAIDSRVAYVAVGVFYALVHSLLEEYYWRWFVFGQLRKFIPFLPANLIASLAFMAHHVVLLASYFGWTSSATYLFSLAVAVGGFYWAWLYERSASLLGPWVSHLLVDAAIFLIGYDLVRDLLA